MMTGRLAKKKKMGCLIIKLYFTMNENRYLIGK